MKNIKNTFRQFKFLVFLVTTLFFIQTKSFGQVRDPGRGLYIDGFATALDSNNLVPAFSILGETAKEDSLIKYAQENHITYFVLYNLSAIFQGDTTKTRLDTLLCNFILKAKNAGIKKIGAAIGGTSSLNLVKGYQFRQLQSTKPWIFSLSEKAQPSYSTIQFVENNYSPSDSLFEIAEITKQALLAAKFNSVAPTCDTTARFDFINLEYEFWNDHSINKKDTSSNTLYKLYKKTQKILDAMSAVRQMNNALHTPIATEQYLGYVDKITGIDSLRIVKYLDDDSLSTGVITPDTKRLINRFLLAYYNTDPDLSYIRPNYLNRNHTFDSAATLDSTVATPLFSAAAIDLGFGENHFGVWFRKSNRNNLFVAEQLWYEDKLADTLQPATIAQRNVSEPGGAVWYTSSIMIEDNANPNKIKHTNTFFSNSPVNTYGNDSGTVSFTYAGPLEIGIPIQLTIKDSLGNIKYTKNATTLNSVTAISLPNIGSKFLKNGTYTASMSLNYGNGNSYTYSEAVTIGNSVRVQAMGNTTICDGGGVILKSGKTSSTGTFFYKWFCNNKYYDTDNSVPYIFAKNAGYYKCKIENSSGILQGTTDSILVTVLNNPDAFILETDITGFGATRKLVASPVDSTASYAWNTGETSSNINLGSTSFGDYEVIITQASGCKKTASVTISSVVCDTLNVALSSNSLSSNFDNASLAASAIFSIGNNFHFNSNFNLSGKTIFALPNTKLIVDSSYTLTLNNQTQIKACSKMWAGIEVSNKGTIVSDSNSVVADAKYGMHLLNGSNYFIRHSVFNKNYIGIFIEGFSHTTNSIGKYSGQSSYIYSSLFDCANNGISTNLTAADSILIYPLGTKPLTGILANGAQMFINLYDSTNNTTFKNLSNGIIAQNNSYVVEHFSHFQNIHADSTYTGIVPVGNGSGFLAYNNFPMYVPRVIGNHNDSITDFMNCDFGTYAFNSSIDVFYNKMDSVNQGVYVNAISPTSTHRTLIKQNTINARQKGVFIANSDSSHASIIIGNKISVGLFPAQSNVCGIEINSTSTSSYPDTSLKVVDNIINCYQADFGIHSQNATNGTFKGNLVKMYNVANTHSTGILLQGAAGTLLEGNLVKGTYNGNDSTQVAININLSDTIKISCNQTDTTAVGFLFAGASIGSDFRTNGIGFSKHGVYLSGSAIIGNQFYKGNIFGNNFEKTAAKNIGNPSLSKFYADSSIQQLFPDTSEIYPSTGWFYPDPTPADSCVLTSIYLPYQTGQQKNNGSTEDVDRIIANGNVNATDFPSETQYLAESHLLERIGRNPSLLNISEIADFYNQNYNGSMSEFVNLQLMQSSYPNYVLIARNQLSSAEFNLKQTINNIELIEAMTSGINEATQRALDSLHILREIQQTIYDSKYEDYHTNYDSFLRTLENINDGILISNLIEQNQQIVNSIYFESIAVRNYSLSQMQFNLLLSVAQQCPFAGGKAVYRARAILATIDNTLMFDDVSNCTQLGFYRKKNEEIKNKSTHDFNFTIKPNPAKDNLIIDGNLLNSELRILNPQGLIVYKTKIQTNDELNLNTSSFANGVYFIAIQNSNGRSTKKIIIIH